jgi:hypothetical protein
MLTTKCEKRVSLLHNRIFFILKSFWDLLEFEFGELYLLLFD